jgi:phage tail sheath protein FI
MPEYLSPGVFVEEVSLSARPITGVGLSTAAFIARTHPNMDEEAYKPVPSYSEFDNRLGDRSPFVEG